MVQTRLEIMLASAVVHLLEARTPGGHALDVVAAQTCLKAVEGELAESDVLLPRPREGTAAQLLGEFLAAG